MPESVRANVSIAPDDAFEPFSTFSTGATDFGDMESSQDWKCVHSPDWPSPMKPRMVVWPTTTMDGVIQRPV